MMFSLFRQPGLGLAARLKCLTLAAVAVLAGCSANPIYTTTGIVLSNYSESEATPYVLPAGIEYYDVVYGGAVGAARCFPIPAIERENNPNFPR